MTWILLLMIMGSGNRAPVIIQISGYTTEESCRAEGARWVAREYRYHSLEFHCVQPPR